MEMTVAQLLKAKYYIPLVYRKEDSDLEPLFSGKVTEECVVVDKDNKPLAHEVTVTPCSKVRVVVAIGSLFFKMVHRDLRFAPRPDGLRNLGSNIIPTRGSTEEWGNKKPPSMRSSDYHEKLCMQQGLAITASHMNAFYDALNLPECVDRAPFNISPTGRRLWRSVGASKKGSFTFFKPAALCSQAYKKPFHDYLMTYLTSNEMDITELFPCADSRPARRPRTDVSEVAYLIRMQRRQLVRASFLEGVSDGQLTRMANSELERRHIDCDFGNSRVEGNRTLDTEGNMESFQAFPRGKIADTVKGYAWGFKIWEDSAYKVESATCTNFVGELFDDDVEPGEYNLSKNAMPYLLLPKDKPVKEELEQIQPLLDHIKGSLCVGEEEDYAVFMGWIAHVAKYPNKKIGWMPIFIGDQGTGKGIILGNLLIKIFDKLGIHCTNFGSVTQKFNSDLEFKSFVFIDEGLFVGKKDEAELMKTLITEPSYRSEKKFCEPLNIKSYHNFVGASNSHKAVAITSDDTRYWIKNTVVMQYSDDQWGHLWSLVNDATIREVFFQYLVTSVDTSVIRIGRAPMTSSKADAAAEQCPVGIKWLKTAVLEQPNCAASVPAWKREHNSRALRNLLDEEYEKACLKDDLRKHSTVKCILPLNHISACVATRFKGQSWMRYNEDDLKRDFKQLGLEPRLARLAGTPRRGLITFPSIEGVIYLLRKKGWLTAAELALEDED
ncbi:hypothetical protein WJX79_003619 [Trebouxia sp. C0005]